MQIESTNNQPTFGIKYTNKRTWNKNVLKTFKDSKLLKDIDSKYPNAKTIYHYYVDSGDIAHGNFWYTNLIEFILDDKKAFRFGYSTQHPENTESSMIEEIRNLTLEKIEKEALPYNKSAMEIDNKHKFPDLITRLIKILSI